MSLCRIVPIVEGQGESDAVPVLIHRIASKFAPGVRVHVPHPIRVPASRLRKVGELERYVQQAACHLDGAGGILILLDCDWKDACPATDAPTLLERAKAARADIPVSVVLANKEYEAWFLAAAESLRGEHGLGTELVSPPNPESIRDAKGWLTQRMSGNLSYSPTLHQRALTRLLDLDRARGARSFDKFYREVEGMIIACAKG